MAKFLTTQGTSYYIENIITSANKRLILISPYIQFPKTFFERLRDADSRDVKITLVCRKGALKSEERSKLGELRNLSLHCLENLHAKSYFNEECMVITSMNIYEFSEKHNREMGLLIRKADDNKAFNDAVKEAKSIVDSATKDDSRRTKPTTRTKHEGYCIRCGTSIAYNLDAPYCSNCYKVWVKWKDPDYLESHCHTCGKDYPTTIDKPMCGSCYWS